MLSIQSITKSGFCPWPSLVRLHGLKRSSAADFPKSSFRQSKKTQGVICSNLLRMQCTFGVPTSVNVATACLFRDDNVTWSKSMRRILETPDRASAATAWDPTPPQPTTIINDDRSFESPSSVRNERLRASCSRISSVWQPQSVR